MSDTIELEMFEEYLRIQNERTVNMADYKAVAKASSGKLSEQDSLYIYLHYEQIFQHFYGESA